MFIACPKCDWRPDPDYVWKCSCGNQWNMFDTHGECPKCGKIWTETQCSNGGFGGCGQWSDHEDWYHQEDDPTVEDFINAATG